MYDLLLVLAAFCCAAWALYLVSGWIEEWLEEKNDAY